MGLSYIKLHYDFLSLMEMLDEASVGRLICAALRHAKGEEVIVEGVERFAYKILVNQIDRDIKAYYKRVEASKENGKMGGRPKASVKVEKNLDNLVGFKKTQEKEKEKEKEKDKDKDKDQENPPGGLRGAIGGNDEVDLTDLEKGTNGNVAESGQTNCSSPVGINRLERAKQVDEEEVECRTSWSESLRGTVKEWFSYKRERRQEYRATARKALLKQVDKWYMKRGEVFVIDSIERSMGANYKGIVWDGTGNGGNGEGGAKPIKRVVDQAYTQRSYDPMEYDLPTTEMMMEVNGI